MKKRLLILFCFYLGLTVSSTFGYSGGSGFKHDPYLIATKADLQYLSENFSEWNFHFRQTADIVFTTADYEVGGNFFNSGALFRPIGNAAVKFTGSYKGGGFTIQNLKVNRTSDFAGLFGWADGATIERLKLTGVNITGFKYVGALVGYTNDVKIYNCYSTGTVSGTQYAGGLVGFLSLNTIEKSASECSVNATSYLGGLVGENDGEIINSYATGAVTGTTEYIGGFIGFNNKTVTNCYSTGLVTGTTNTGGFIGYDLGGIITDCFWDTQTSGKASSAGDEIGKTTTQMKTQATFTNWSFPAIWNIGANGYPTLKWIIVACTPTSYTFSITTYNAYDLNSVTYTESGTYVQILNNANDCDSTITLNLSIVPYPFSGGSGTAGDPYRIANKSDLKYISEHDNTWAFHFRQTADIVFTAADFQAGGDHYEFGFGFRPIAITSQRFTGSYDGNGHTIENLLINRPTYNLVGLFGTIHSTSTINNVHLVNATITGGDKTAALVAESFGTVVNCSSSGTVNGATDTGGLVGINMGGSISKSYSSASVTGYHNVGGLLGNASFTGSINSTVDNCYATGSLTATNYVGGLIGWLYTGTVDNCYATGSITAHPAADRGGITSYNSYATVTNCFWDMDASSEPSTFTGTGTGKTTAQMQTQSTFTGWDFTNIWEIQASAYPTLRPASVISNVTSRANATSYHAFPNPAKEKLNFSMSGSYEIFNSYGISVIKGEGESVDVSFLTTGVYHIRMNGQTLAFIKE
ncbi:MAG: hypothetical protein MUF42_16880 [Cytophagaceae bacterium]|jgi:hypothetical protein|nr:hypothetical protein [Cytophagaceae bacterium]